MVRSFEMNWKTKRSRSAAKAAMIFCKNVNVTDYSELLEAPSMQSRSADLLVHTFSTILNLPETATDAEIRERYRSLAVVYHPDRNSDPGRKEAAERHFRDLQRAYEVLTDPQKRAVYDLLGEEGLKTSWEVGRRLKTPEEVRSSAGLEKVLSPADIWYICQ